MTTKKKSSEPEQAPRMLSVYSGTKHLGFLLLRGRDSVEALDTGNTSLGIFSDQKSAASAVSANAQFGRAPKHDEVSS
jgi:hypothetical protein